MADYHFTITANVRRAVWPGERAVCAVLSAPKYFVDQWYLGSIETGRVSELRVYRLGMFGGRDGE